MSDEQRCPLCGHSPLTVEHREYGFPKVTAAPPPAPSGLREALEQVAHIAHARLHNVHLYNWNSDPKCPDEPCPRARAALAAPATEPELGSAGARPSAAGLDMERLQRIANRHIADAFENAEAGLSDGRWKAIAQEYAAAAQSSEADGQPIGEASPILEVEGPGT